MRTYLLYTHVFLGNLIRRAFSRKDPSRGYFIVIDGGEGSGKSTVIERLKAKYPQVEFSREPGGTPYAEEIRKVMLNSEYAKDASGRTILLLVSAGRSDHMDKKAVPTVLSGRHFITDRSDSTSWGYQIGGQEGGYDLKKLFFSIRRVMYKKVRPDLHIILEVDPAEGARRVASRKGEVNHFDERKHDFHIRVMKAYRVFGKLFPGEVKFANANKSKDEVFAEVDAILAPLLAKSA
jgi:dTMP kinase